MHLHQTKNHGGGSGFIYSTHCEVFTGWMWCLRLLYEPRQGIIFTPNPDNRHENFPVWPDEGYRRHAVAAFPRKMKPIANRCCGHQKCSRSGPRHRCRSRVNPNPTQQLIPETPPHCVAHYYKQKQLQSDTCERSYLRDFSPRELLLPTIVEPVYGRSCT